MSTDNLRTALLQLGRTLNGEHHVESILSALTRQMDPITRGEAEKWLLGTLQDASGGYDTGRACTILAIAAQLNYRGVLRGRIPNPLDPLAIDHLCDAIAKGFDLRPPRELTISPQRTQHGDGATRLVDPQNPTETKGSR